MCASLRVIETLGRNESKRSLASRSEIPFPSRKGRIIDRPILLLERFE